MSVNSKMTAMANSIRALLGLSGTMGLDAMVTHIGTEKTNVDNALTAIAGKGVEVPSGANSGNLAELIASITGVGGKDFPNGTEWTQSNLTAGTSAYGWAYGNGVWAVGTTSGVFYSADGKQWTKSNLNDRGISSMVYADGMWVCGGENGAYTSVDGMTWTATDLGDIGVPNGLCKANGLFVMSYDGGLAYSTDFDTWTIADVDSYYFFRVFNADGVWVAGTMGASGNGLFYSTDGKTWTQSNVTRGGFVNIKYANGMWVACSYVRSSVGIWYSTDGMTWTQSNVTHNYCYAVDYARGVWVATTDRGIYYSLDGMTWALTNIEMDGYAGGVHYANGLWTCGAGTSIWYSVDGISWEVAEGTVSDVASIYNADGVWVAFDLELGAFYSVAWEPS